MEATILLARDVVNAADGSTDILGVLTDFQTSVFPVKLPRMLVYTRLVFYSAENGREFNLGLTLVDEDGQQLAATTANTPIRVHVQGRRLTFESSIHLGDVIFEKPGTYEIALIIDNDVMATLDFDLHLSKH